MMDSRVTEEIQLKLDLVAASLEQLAFLAEVDKHPCLYEGPVLQRAICRYEKFWLPLVCEHRDTILTPPLDIGWAWYCHMLAPVAYQEDCLNLFGHVPDHILGNARKSPKKVKHMWEVKHGREPFQVSLTPDLMDQDFTFKSALSYDIAAAASRQKSFYYQVSLPHFKDRKYLQHSLRRYLKFLFLKKQHPDKFLVPCYGIDIMWHSHQLYPSVYKADTERILGQLYNHNDSVNERHEGSRLNKADQFTRMQWKDTFGESFSNFGSMYRGEPPTGKLYAMTDLEKVGVCTKVAEIRVGKVAVNVPNIEGKIQFYAYTAPYAERGLPFLSFEGQDREWRNKDDDIKIVFNTLCHKQLIFIVKYEKPTFLCWSTTTKKIGEASQDTISIVEHLGIEKKVFTQTLDIISASHPDSKVSLDMTFTPSGAGRGMFFIKRGPFCLSTMPENIEQMWGPIPLPKEPTGSNNVRVGTHIMMNHFNEDVFTVRVIHCVQYLMSAIQVFYKDKMAAVAHLIASDQLPFPSQVGKSEKCVCLNAKDGERAVLIKNHGGDWAIVTGKWTGQRKGRAGVPGTSSRKAVPAVKGSLGTLVVKMFSLKESTCFRQPLNYHGDIYKFKLSDITVDQTCGTVLVDPITKEIAENLALAFSVSLLHVLCQPRPANSTRGDKSVGYVPSEDFPIVMAAGYLEETPSNFYIRQQNRPTVCSWCGGCMGYTGADDMGDMGRDARYKRWRRRGGWYVWRCRGSGGG